MQAIVPNNNTERIFNLKINICNIFYLKLISELFYNNMVIKYLIMTCALLLGLKTVIINSETKYDIKKYFKYVIIVMLAVLISCHFIITPKTFSVGFNVLSAFMLFIIGVYNFEDTDSLLKKLYKGYLIIWIIDILCYIFKIGFISWGNAKTFVGLYYFKLDLVIPLVEFVFLNLFVQNKNNIFKAIFMASSVWLVILSNSRIAIIMLLYSFFLFFLYKKEKKMNHTFKITAKFLLYLLIVFIVSLVILQYLSSTSIFESHGFIGFDTSKLSDVFNGANTQGRNKIWEDYINEYKNLPIIKKILGNGFDFSSYEHNPHSLYVGMLYSTGILGITLLFAFVFQLRKSFNNCKDRQLAYIMLFYLGIFLIGGISDFSLLTTKFTWFFMFFAGKCIRAADSAK